MTTSSTYNYSVTAAQVIQLAWEDLGLSGSGVTIGTNDQTLMLVRLNLLAKQWQGKNDMAPGLKIWTRKRLALFFVKNQARYLVGPATTDDRATDAYNSTLTTAAKSASATALSVADSTGMTAGDQIGIQLTDGTLGWTTISVVNSSVSLTLAANSLGAASSGAVIFTYTNKAQRFIDTEAVELRDNSAPTQPIDMPIGIYRTVQDYEGNVTQKLAPGDPINILVEPTRLNTVVTCDFAAANVYKLLRIVALYPAENYDATTNDIAFPQEWFAALGWELAMRCAPAFGVPFNAEMLRNYTTSISIARELNPEASSQYFQAGRD